MVGLLCSILLLLQLRFRVQYPLEDDSIRRFRYGRYCGHYHANDLGYRAEPDSSQPIQR